MKKYLTSIIIFIVFETVAISLWLSKDNLFYLLNFSYIGSCIAVGSLAAMYFIMRSALHLPMCLRIIVHFANTYVRLQSF